jgi:hypothetical protein
MFGKKNPLSSKAPEGYVPPAAYEEEIAASGNALRTGENARIDEEQAIFFEKNKLPGAATARQMADGSLESSFDARKQEIAAAEKIKALKKGTYGYFKDGEEGPQKEGGRRRSRRRGRKSRRGSRRA